MRLVQGCAALVRLQADPEFLHCRARAAQAGCHFLAPLPAPLQWYASLPANIGSHTSANLLQQDKSAGGLLRVALSPQLHAALEEGFLLERQRLGVPLAVAQLLQELPRLRSLWVSGVQVCRAYNAVLGSLSAEDRRLCRDRIRWAGHSGMGRGGMSVQGGKRAWRQLMNVRRVCDRLSCTARLQVQQVR